MNEKTEDPFDTDIDELQTASVGTELFYDEIDTRDLFGGNNEREKILIFEVI